MKDILKRSLKPYYEEPSCILIFDDTFKAMKKIKPGTIDMIFADPPYFLSNDGITCSGGKMVSVNKGKWDKADTFKDKHTFNRKWIKLCYELLKPNGTIWISGTYHNIYSVGAALEEEGFKIINNITWRKTNPPPNLACRCFTHSTETIIWAKKNNKKAKHIFNYANMKAENGGKQMKDVWEGTLTSKKEKSFGKHPTQKPLYILERIIKASTNEDAIVLDPFCGSSTTGVACKMLGRKYIGIDNNEEYIKLSKARIENYGEETI